MVPLSYYLVLSGFLTQLFNVTPPRTWPGLYISSYYWSNLLGTAYRPVTDFVLDAIAGGNGRDPPRHLLLISLFLFLLFFFEYSQIILS